MKSECSIRKGSHTYYLLALIRAFPMCRMPFGSVDVKPEISVAGSKGVSGSDLNQAACTAVVPRPARDEGLHQIQTQTSSTLAKGVP